MVRSGEDLERKVCGRVVSVDGAEGTAGPKHGDRIRVLVPHEDLSVGQGPGERGGFGSGPEQREERESRSWG